METAESIKKTLKSLGLARDPAAIYSLLLSDGPQKASDLVRKSHISRPLVYRALEDLESQNLVITKKRPGQVTLFEAQDPRQLRRNMEQQIQQLASNQALLEGLLPALLANYSQNLDKPLFRYEDDLNGVIDLFQASNFAETTVYQYIDPELMESDRFRSITQKLTKQRLAAGTHKILLYPDTEFAYSYIQQFPDFEQYIAPGFPAYPIALLAFDSTITIISISDNRITGFSIQDPHLSDFVCRTLQSLWGIVSKS